MRRTTAAAASHPVAFVTWPNALAYCRWLEGVLAKTPGAVGDRVRAGWRVTLPTEAQWEKAARGGDRRAYPWGDQPRKDRGNFEGTGTTPVGQFACPECPYGLADMSGNVWEWTSSPYQPYPYDPSDDRANLDADALWVMRGGHFARSRPASAHHHARRRRPRRPARVHRLPRRAGSEVEQENKEIRRITSVGLLISCLIYASTGRWAGLIPMVTLRPSPVRN